MAQADIYIFPLFWQPGWSEASIRSAYADFLSLGINSFMSAKHQEDYRDNPEAMYWYDRVYDLAAEYGIKIFWYCGGWGSCVPGSGRYAFRNPNNNQRWIDRYKVKSSCAGWFYADEPACKHYDHDGCLWGINDIKSYDPNHPVFAIWSADIPHFYEYYMKTCYPDFCAVTADLSCSDIYPHNFGGDNWKCFLGYKSAGLYNHSLGGWKDCVPIKDHIAVIETGAHGWKSPDIVGQHNILKDGMDGSGCPTPFNWVGWGDKLIGIGLYGAANHLWSSGTVGVILREQIRTLARLRGWTEEPLPEEFTTQEITCSGCGAGLELTISSIPEKNVSQSCPICGTLAD